MHSSGFLKEQGAWLRTLLGTEYNPHYRKEGIIPLQQLDAQHAQRALN